MSPSRVITFAKGVIKHLGNITETLEHLINMGVLDEKRATLALRSILKTEDTNEILILTEIDNEGKVKYSAVDALAPVPSTPRSIKVETPRSTKPVKSVEYLKSPVFVPLNDLSNSLATSPLPLKLDATSPAFIPSQGLSDAPTPGRPLSPKLDPTSTAFVPSKALIHSPTSLLSLKLNSSSPAFIPSKDLNYSPAAGSRSPKLDATSPAFVPFKVTSDSLVPTGPLSSDNNASARAFIRPQDLSHSTAACSESESEKSKSQQEVAKPEPEIKRSNNPWSNWNAKEADKKLDEERARLLAAQTPVDPNTVLYKETYIPTAVVNGERMKTSPPEKRIIRHSGVESSIIEEVTVSEISKDIGTEKGSWDTYPDPSSPKALSDISEKERNKENHSPSSFIAVVTEKKLPHNQTSPKPRDGLTKTHLRTKAQIVRLVSEGPKSSNTFNFMKSTVDGRNGLAGPTKHWRGAIVETQEQRLGDGRNFFATEKGDRFEVLLWISKDKYLVRRAGVEGKNGFINIFKVDMSVGLHQSSAGMCTPSNGSVTSTNH